MTTPPAIVQPAVRAARPQAQVARPSASARFGQQGSTPVNVKPNVTTSSRFSMQRGMSQAGQEASKLVKPPTPFERIGAQAASKAPGVLGTVGRIAANPIVGGVAAAMDPTPANAGENEFSRQAKYGAKPAASTPATKQAAATPKTTPAPGPQPKAPPPAPAAASAAASAPKTGNASKVTPTITKSGFYKGGSQGDYTIKKGDTLSGIAKRTGQSVSDLAKMNKISDVNKISSGAKLMTKVPTPPSRPADTSSATKSTSAPASSSYKPVSPGTDIDKKYSSGYRKSSFDIGTVKTPTAADDKAGVTGKTTGEYGSIVRQDFDNVRTGRSTRIAKIGLDYAGYDHTASDSVASRFGADQEKMKEKIRAERPTPAPTPAPAPTPTPPPAPKAPEPEQKKKEAGTIPSSGTVAECVQIGANKYRIV